MNNVGIITQSLLITFIGMVILFISLFILWGVIELLVRFLKHPAEAAEEIEEPEVVSVGEDELKMRAAAAAVASIQDYDLKMKIAAAAASAVSVKK